MPLYIIIIIALIAFVSVIAFAVRNGKVDWLKKRWGDLAVFLLSALSLFITFTNFINVAQYVDESGASPYLVYGNKQGLYLAWIGLGVILLVCIVSGVKLISCPKDEVNKMSKKDLK
jgi:dipeptide/tripeptide permease